MDEPTSNSSSSPKSASSQTWTAFIGEVSTDTSDETSNQALSDAWSRVESAESLTDAEDASQEEEDDQEVEVRADDGVQHPRCIYEDIRRRDISSDLKSLIPGCSSQELGNLLYDAQAKKYSLFEIRDSSPLCKTQNEMENQAQWEHRLIAEYQRQANARLDALEADIAYFRRLLDELVKALFGQSVKIHWPHLDAVRDEMHRVHREICDSCANILVLRLRAGSLLEDFISAFRHKRQVSGGAWNHNDQLIPLFRTPIWARFSRQQFSLREKRIQQERQKSARVALVEWGWKRCRKEGARGWYLNDKGFRALEIALVNCLVPPCLSERLARYLFGADFVSFSSPQNSIPALALRVGVGILAPALENDHTNAPPPPPDSTVSSSSSTSSAATYSPSSGGEKWIYKNLCAAKIDHWYPNTPTVPTFVLKQFKTPSYPCQPPDRRCAYFHLLMNMFWARRFSTAAANGESWEKHIDEMLREERWGRPAGAPWMRTSTMAKIAATIGRVEDFDAAFRAGMMGQDGDNGADGLEADDDDDEDLDMLIANILEEHVFPSPPVFVAEGLSLKPLVWGETDIVAEMQRRRDVEFEREYFGLDD
ncbi:hypothetical protein BKA81DRAFT_427769 [Phyllosticta paracitricarpa]|uniref:Uncharacterized protein n=1 Tax=Phyllosticta paracitricarpa TaxID=2016321 RepID=A0ABR1N725_9PEZI